MTSLVFMLDEVPEPVWNTSIGNWSSYPPSATCAAAVAIALATSVVEHAEIGVDLRGGALDLGQRPDVRGFQATPGDREVLHRPLGLRPPQGVGGHPDLAHRVAFDPEAALVSRHGSIVPPPTASCS